MPVKELCSNWSEIFAGSNLPDSMFFVCLFFINQVFLLNF